MKNLKPKIIFGHFIYFDWIIEFFYKFIDFIIEILKDYYYNISNIVSDMYYSCIRDYKIQNPQLLKYFCIPHKV